jgi:hypothetical protein
MRLILLLLFFCARLVHAEDEDVGLGQEAIVVLPATQVHRGDLFAVGRSVEISGVVEGDLYVIGGQVIVDGVVHGDVLALGGSVVISGKVGRSCRVIGAQVFISGSVGHNVSVVSGNLQLLGTASIGGSLAAASAIVDTAAEIHSKVALVAANARVSSSIAQDLEGYVGKLRLTSKAVIGGDLNYHSSTAASIDPGATIRGEVIFHPSFMNKMVNATWLHRLLLGSQVVATLMNFIYTFVIGAFLIRLFPANLSSGLHALSDRPLKSLLHGALLLVVLPLAFLLLLITILGVPFALTLMALNIMGFYTAKVYPILWVAHWGSSKIGWQRHRLLSFFVALLCYFALAAIPTFGPFLALIALLLGLGAGIAAQNRHGVFVKN